MVLFTCNYRFESHDVSISSLTVDIDWFMQHIVRQTSVIMTEKTIVHTHAVEDVLFELKL